MEPTLRFRRAAREALAVSAALLPVVTAIFGRPVIGHLASRVLGVGRDPEIFVWSLAWWPHAIASAQDPLTTHAVWAGTGFDVLWSSSVPGLSLLGLPLTALFGPTVAYNVLALCAPALAGGAVHLLCRACGAGRAGAAAAALLFAVGPYEAATMQGHVHLAFVAPGIVAAALTVWAMRDPRPRKRWIGAIAAALALQFLVAPELFVTFLGAGAAAMLIAARVSAPSRPLVRTAARTVAVATLLAVALTSPLFVHMALHGPGTLYDTSTYSTDVLNLVVPTRLTALRPPFAEAVAGRFTGGSAEQPGYLGLVVVMLLAGLALRRETRRRFAVPLAFLGVMVVASLGPLIHIAGSPGGPLPMTLATHVPLLGNVLPSRLGLFAWIAVCVIVAVWLRGRGPRRRWAVLAAIVATVAPAMTNAGLWYAPVQTGRAFADAGPRLVRDDERALVLPMESSDVLRRQAEDGFRFQLAAGMPPAPVGYDETRPRDVATILRRGGIDVVVVDAHEDRRFRPLLRAHGLVPTATAGALVYRRVAGSCTRPCATSPT